MSVKSVLRQWVRTTGFDLVRVAPGAGLSAADARRARFLRDAGVTCVLDVGANVGQYAQGLRAGGYAGRIVSFEPLGAAYQELAARAAADPSWDVRNVGLGAARFEAEINVAANSESSSLLPMGGEHESAAPESRYVGTERIEVVPLDAIRDQVLGPADTAWVKVDVQGYELQVLEGAAGTLGRVRGLELELSLVPLYVGAPLIEDVIARVRALGFVLAAVEDVFTDPRTGDTLQYAGTFVRRDRAPGGPAGGAA